MSRSRVLLADDHPAVLDQVERLLAEDAEVVGKFCDGQALLDAVAVSAPDLLIIDISMPRVDGLEVTRRLRASGLRVPIVFLTVHDDPDFVRAAFDAGGNGYVVKSRLASDLLTCIEEVTAGHRFVSPTAALGADPPPTLPECQF